MSHFKIIFTVLFIFNLSCKNDDNINLQPTHCIENPESSFPISCDAFASINFSCGITELGTFYLKESSKNFMPLFCEDIGKILRFENENGDIQELELVNKLHKKYRGVYGSTEICPMDSTQSMGICLEYEEVSVSLKGIDESQGFNFQIKLKVKPDIDKDNIGRVGDFLEIIRGIDSLFLISMNVVINKRDLSYEETFNQINHESIELLGKNYENVVSNVTSFIPIINPPISLPFGYYYNTEVGLIAFSDTNNILWRIIE